MIRFLMPLLSGVLVAGLASAAPLSLDGFDLLQGPIHSHSGNPASDTITNDGSFMGPSGTSWRTIHVVGTGKTPPPSTQNTTVEIGGGMFELVSPSDSESKAILTYGDLNGLDLSKHYGFTFHDLITDHTINYEVSVLDTFGGLSTASGSFALPMGIATDALLSFSDFLGGADLKSIDQLMFAFSSNELGFDFSMTQISAAIPIPAAGFFLVTALAGLGLLRSRKMAEAA